MMNYDNKDEWEVVRKIFDKNSANLSTKQIASFLGLTWENMLKWGENPNYSGSPIPKKHMLAFSKFTKDIRLWGWYLYQLGYYPAPIENGKMTNGDIMDDVMRYDCLRGELAKKLLDALHDSNLPRPECKEMIDLSQRMIEELRTFQEELKIKLNT